jgi:type I pantothenate kinase
MRRKGFPESYDVRRLVQFVSDIKSGMAEVRAPVYSHTRYDIVPGDAHVVTQPDILILEGLNVLQSGSPRGKRSQRVFVSDFFDFSIYVDADARHIENWYVERFMTLRETVFRNPDSYFSHYAALTPAEAREVARGIWSSINLVNLRENILPTRERAHLILDKGATHAVERVMLRRL